MVGKIRANLIELYSRSISVNKSDTKKIYSNGEGNLYPYEIERVINNSPTATLVCGMMSKFISGKGVENDRIVNSKKQYYLSDIVDIMADDLAPQNGCFIWVGYGFNENAEPFQQKLDILDYSNSRISKEDDNEYPGKVYLKDYQKTNVFWQRDSGADTWYYPYNPSKDIVIAQMKADARAGLKLKKDDDVTIEQMVKHYRGQVSYLNLTPKYKYALSKFDSVFNDCDTEFRLSLYTNREMRTGFLGKLIAITQGLDEKQIESIDDDFGKLFGAENTGNMLHLQANAGADLSQVLKLEQVKPMVDDKLLNESEKRIKRNILGAGDNVPEGLIYSPDGIFGDSGGKYIEMKEFYQEQTLKTRSKIEKHLKKLGFETKIIPLIEENTDNGTTPTI